MNFGVILACLSYILTDKKKGRERKIKFNKNLTLILIFTIIKTLFARVIYFKSLVKILNLKRAS